MTAPVENVTRTDREQAVAGLRALAELVEGGTVPVPTSIRAQFFPGSPEDVERVAAAHGMECEPEQFGDHLAYAVRITVGHVGIHPIEYVAYASVSIEASE